MVEPAVRGDRQHPLLDSGRGPLVILAGAENHATFICHAATVSCARHCASRALRAASLAGSNAGHARPEENEDDTAKTDDAKLWPILSSKLFLYVTEFFSGMGVMAAELGASRLLIVTVSTNFPVIAALAACRPS